MEMPFMGRRRILTSCLPKNMQPPGYVGDTLDENTIARELTEVLRQHYRNAMEFQRLKEIYLGDQEILHRPKGDREVNNRIVVNFAQAFTRDITGYTYGNGIQYVAKSADKVAEVQELNRLVQAEYKTAITKSLGDNQSIGGHGFLAVLPDAVEKNGIPFEFVELDPCNTEVVYSTYNVNAPVFAFTIYCTKVKGKKQNIFQVWTADRCYTLSSPSAERVQSSDLVKSVIDLRGEKIALPYVPNIIGEIPIVEYQNNQFRLGDWEFAIPLFNALNSIVSDSINDVEQLVISYLALFGVEADREALKKAKQDRTLVFSGVAGVNQDAKFITAPLDGNGVQLLRSYLEQALKFIVGIPDRDTGQAGSDTGISAEVRTGSGDLEIVAANKCTFTTMAERRTLKILLKILQLNGLVPGLTDADIDIEIPRSKTDQLQSKVQAGSMLYSMKVDKSDIARIMDLNTDITGFVQRWRESEKRITEAEKEKATPVKTEPKLKEVAVRAGAGQG